MPSSPQYDPKIPDALKREIDSDESKPDEDAADHNEAALTTTGEEMRPKDGTLDGGSAR